MDILEEITAYKRIEVKQLEEAVPPHVIHEEVECLIIAEDTLRAQGVTRHPETNVPTSRHSLRQALLDDEIGIIAEFKRKSPSKGWIREDGKPEVIPASYARNGAAALSILTDSHYFSGSDRFLRKARPTVDIPILYKNFVIDEYQLFCARSCGADAVLLIAACLTKDECRSLLKTAHELELEVLLEVHSEKELSYIDCLPDVVGVNNRNLGTFHTDVEASLQLASLLPDEIVHISESGISDPQKVVQLRQAGFRGFLIGEHFMRQPDPGIALKQFIDSVRKQSSENIIDITSIH
jgi:indole-3-glycerol phosphate synthase